MTDINSGRPSNIRNDRNDITRNDKFYATNFNDNCNSEYSDSNHNKSNNEDSYTNNITNGNFRQN